MKTVASSEHQSSQSSTRLLQILECLASSRIPMRLQDIAVQVNMTQPTVLRYLYSLQSANYIYQEDDTARYALTWRVCSLGKNLDSQLGLRNITTPFINRLANTFSIGTCLVVEQNNDCIYLDCIDNPNSFTPQRIGKQAPMHATGSGKVLLAQYNEYQLNDYISAKGLQRFTEYTIVDPDALKRELAQIRHQGFGMDEEECEIGLRCISCPIYNYSGSVVAAMSMFGRPIDLTDKRVKDEILPALKEATTIISTRLGYCYGE